MKESYGENLASYSGLEPYADDGNIAGVAPARGNAPPAIELGKSPLPRADLVLTWRRRHRRRRYLARRDADAAELAEERGSPKGNTNQKALPRTRRHNGKSIGWSVYGKYGECEFTPPSYPREEPYEVIPHVRIRAGGGP